LADLSKEVRVPAWLIFALIGIFAGVASGLFGVGGGIVIVPALIFFAGFSQHLATGTSLAVLLPPIGLAATLEYYRHGNVDLRAALLVAAGVFTGSWLASIFANQVSGARLRLVFGAFMMALGLYLVFGALRRPGGV
jgi:uncharacterized membrane protein YfcA